MQDEASSLFKCGYNCAQSVFAAHAPKLGIDKETALRISAPLGGGVGRMRQTCGAFLACAMLWGLKNASGSDSLEAKEQVYKDTQRLAEIFVSENGSLVCRELLKLAADAPTPPTPDPRTQAYYDSRPCSNIVARASSMIQKELS